MSTSKTFEAAGLDAGSAWTRCVICQLEDGRVRFRGYGEAPSHGWVKGRVVDRNAAAESILAAVRQAELNAQVSLDQVVLGVGTHVRGHNCRGPLDLGRPRTIEQRDVNRSISRACRVQLPEDRMVLHIFPQDFVIDGHPGHRDPRKMIGTQLDANVHLVTTSLREHDGLVAAVNQAHLAVEETVCESLAACYAAVLPEDRREGVALLVIGAQSSELVVYYGDAIQLATSLRVSGDHFTRDVARGLYLSFEDAGIIKHEFGCVDAAATPENSFVEVRSRSDRPVSRRTLNHILEARAEELFQYVRGELERIGMQDALIGGFFIAGGGARMDGMCDLAERFLRCQARKALPIGIQDWPEEIYDASWTTAAGLAMYSANLKAQQVLRRQSTGLLGRVLK